MVLILNRSKKMSKILTISTVVVAVGVCLLYLCEYYIHYNIQDTRNCLQIEALSRDLSMEGINDHCSRFITKSVAVK